MAAAETSHGAPAPGRRLGVLFDRATQPSALPEFARRVEALGADDLWVVEDLGWTGSVAMTATALAATGSIRVGIGIAPAPLRSPALLAMELSALAHLHPGRLIAGVGHGVPKWMGRVALPPPSKLALLEETLTCVSRLLRGETVAGDRGVLFLDQVTLHNPPGRPPPLYVGAIRPRSLELSGRIADGTILAEGTTPRVLRRARHHIARGQAATGRTAHHEVVVYTHILVHHDGAYITTAMSPIIAEFAAFQGIEPADDLVGTGTASQVADHIERLWGAGADTVVLRPVGTGALHQVALVAQELTRRPPGAGAGRR